MRRRAKSEPRRRASRRRESGDNSKSSPPRPRNPEDLRCHGHYSPTSRGATSRGSVHAHLARATPRYGGGRRGTVPSGLTLEGLLALPVPATASARPSTVGGSAPASRLRVASEWSDRAVAVPTSPPDSGREPSAVVAIRPKRAFTSHGEHPREQTGATCNCDDQTSQQFTELGIT